LKEQIYLRVFISDPIPIYVPRSASFELVVYLPCKLPQGSNHNWKLSVKTGKQHAHEHLEDNLVTFFVPRYARCCVFRFQYNEQSCLAESENSCRTNISTKLRCYVCKNEKEL